MMVCCDGIVGQEELKYPNQRSFVDQLVEGRLRDRVMAAKGTRRRGESRLTILTDWGVMRARRR